MLAPIFVNKDEDRTPTGEVEEREERVSEWAKARSAAEGTPSSSVAKEKKKAMGINR